MKQLLVGLYVQAVAACMLVLHDPLLPFGSSQRQGHYAAGVQIIFEQLRTKYQASKQAMHVAQEMKCH
jgi:hypothetical protein